MVRVESSNSKSDDSECYHHLRTLKSKLHDFNSTLKKNSFKCWHITTYSRYKYASKFV